MSGPRAEGRGRAGSVRSLLASRPRTGRALGVLVVFGVVLPLAASASASAEQASFSFTGGRQFFTVPDKVHSLVIIVQGASGGSGLGGDLQGAGGPGGAGAVVEGTLAVNPGDQLTVDVGQKGSDSSRTGQGDSPGGTGGASPSGHGGGAGGDGDGGGGGGGGAGAASGVVFNGTTVIVASGGGGGGGAAGIIGSNGGGGGSASFDGMGTGLNGTGIGFGTGGNFAVAPTIQGTDGGAACTACDSGGGGGGGGGAARGGGGGGAGGLGPGGGGGGGTGGTMVAPVLSDVTIAQAPGGVDGEVLINWNPPDSTSTAVSCSPDPVAVDAPTTCTATVTDTALIFQATPTARVCFSSDGNDCRGGGSQIGECDLSGSGRSASCSVTYTPSATGSQTISAFYDGDRIHTGSQSPGETLTVVKRSSSTGVSCSPNPMTAGVATTCTATVAGGPPAPTGTVGFGSDGAGRFSDHQCTLAGAGPTASCSVTFTPNAVVGTGAHTISAGYGGDATYDQSSGREAVTVVRATSTGVSCSPGTVAVGQATRCTVTVTDPVGGPGSTPSGRVMFARTGGGEFNAPECTLLGAGRSATCSVTYTPSATGSQTITADYRGDAGHADSSGSETVTVLRPASTGVSCVPAAVAVGQATTCTATVSDGGAGASTPTGMVSFGSTGAGGFSAKQCALSGSGVSASCAVTFTPSGVGGGSDPITASYGGDAGHASSSDTQAVTVTGRETSTSVSCSPHVVPIERSTTCTATVVDVSDGTPITPTGNVGFFPDGPGSFNGTSPCTLSGSGGSASCSATFTPTGPETGGETTIRTSYVGDDLHQVSGGSTSVEVRRVSEADCAGRTARLTGTGAADRLAGTSARNVIAGGSGNDRILARGGGDLVCAGAGSDRVLGGLGNDRIFGGSGTDSISGGPGDDHITPGPGRDRASAGAGNDRITSADGRRDVIDCGPGRDTATVDAIDRVRRCENSSSTRTNPQ
jgi:hypothetical protein